MSTAAVSSQTFRVLIVDDEEPVRRFVERVVQQPGHRTRVASDGLEALQIADTEGPFDLLMADLDMPGMSGDELARRLRRDNPALKILYLTGHSDRLFDVRGVLWEGEAFLEKPASVQGILEAVSLLLLGSLPAPRAPRVHVPGARVRIADSVADLESLSATGGLIRSPVAVPVGGNLSVVLEFPVQTVHITARVVSCTGTEVAPASGAAAETAPYRIALAFAEPRASVRRVLQRVCDEVSDPAT